MKFLGMGVFLSTIVEIQVKVKSLSHVRLFATPWTAAYQAPPSMGFSRQEYWSGVPLPSPGVISNWWIMTVRFRMLCVCVCVCVFNELFLHLLLCLMKIHHLEAGYGNWPSDFLLPLSASLSFCSIFWAFWSTLSSKPVISKVLHCCCPCLLCPFLCFILLISYLISVKILMTVFLFYFILGWFWSLWIH